MNSVPPRDELFAFGVWQGVKTWLVYATLEFFFATVLDLYFTPQGTLPIWHWALTGRLLAGYIVAGGVLGALAAFVAGRWNLPFRQAPRNTELFITLTIPVMFLVNMAVNVTLNRSEVVAGTLAFCLLAVLLVSLIRPDWRERLETLSEAWVVSLLLLAIPYLIRGRMRDDSTLVKATAVAVVLAAVLAVAYAAKRLGWRGGASWVAALMGASAGMALLGSLTFRSPAKLPDPAVVSRNSRPNVILIVMDTVRADHLTLYGYNRTTTPELAAFAAGATLYRHSFAVSGMTLPTHASLFTGIYPNEHGAHYAPPTHRIGRPLPPGFPTVAGTLARAGYSTLAVAANYAYLQPSFGLNRGFQIYLTPVPIEVINEDHKLFLRYGLRRVLGAFMPGLDFDRRTLLAEEVNQRADGLLQQAQQRNAPFFLFLNYMDAHRPYLPPAPFDRLFPGKQNDLTDKKCNEMKREVMSMERPVRPEEREHLISQYDGGIAYLDSQIGRLLRHLREIGVYDQSMIVVTADHGEAFGERNLMEHAVSVYQDQISVPLLIKYPGQQVGRTVDEPVNQLDIPVTMLAAAKVPATPQMHGVNLDGPIEPGRTLFAVSYPPVLIASWNAKYKREQRAAVQNLEKLVVSTAGAREKYDLRGDPQETRNLYRTDDPMSGYLTKSLSQWMKVTPASLSLPDTSSPEVLKQLKSLGYTQ